MENTDLEKFMVKLRRLVYDNDRDTPIGNNPLIRARQPQIQLLYEELSYLINGSCFKYEDDLQDFGNWNGRVIQAAEDAEDTVDMFLSLADHFQSMTNLPLTQRYHLLRHSLKYLQGVIENVKSIRAELSFENVNLYQNHVNRQDMTSTDNKFEATCVRGNTRVNLSSIQHKELIVGFEEDALLLIDRLTGHRRKLDIISIVGMGGQGKTTLATKIFNDSLVEYHFDKRGWVTVSQAYSKRDLLLQLLASIGKSVDESVSDSKMCEVLYQSLKRMKYLIVVDDIWSCKAWDDVRLCFPDDNNGSRVLVTTRLTEVALRASQRSFTHNLPHLTEDQSWELLCRKTFRGHECPESLIETGKHIAKKCGGLPLALVVIAGVLEKGEKTVDLWERIAKRVGSYIINDPKGCWDTLALSYDHLPFHLKKCFLYVGGFPEDYKIEVQRLIWLWMAEGFIKQSGQRSLEEEGEYYLMDLVDRNLLIVADRSSDGGVKSCRLHDILRELCLKKADEDIFLTTVFGSDSCSGINQTEENYLTSSINLDSDLGMSGYRYRKYRCQKYQYRFFHILGIDFFKFRKYWYRSHTENSKFGTDSVPTVSNRYQLSTDGIKSVSIRYRYQGTSTRFAHPYFDSGSSIVKQRRVFTKYEVLSKFNSQEFWTQTRSVLCFHNSPQSTYRTACWVHSFLLLRVLNLPNIPLDDSSNITMLVHLRYLAVWPCCHELAFSKAGVRNLQTLIVKGGYQNFVYSADAMVNLRHLRCDRIDLPIDFSVPALLNLQTISRLILDRKTHCVLESFIPNIKKLGCSISSTSGNDHGILSFAMLTHLEALNIDTYMPGLANPIRFPETLRKLTLRGLSLPWKYMLTVQLLPKLEVLKLLDSSFEGRLWETGDEQFHQLRYLKLARLSISVWRTSNINFPRLRKLAVIRCKYLKEIPLVLGNISTLEQIETDDSNSLVLDSVNRIQKAQQEIGNNDIHVNVHQRDYPNRCEFSLI